LSLFYSLSSDLSLAETTCYQATEAQLLLDVVDNLISREVAAAAGHSGSAVAPTRLSVQHIYDFDLLKVMQKLGATMRFVQIVTNSGRYLVPS
jgi:hypothetical protein